MLVNASLCLVHLGVLYNNHLSNPKGLDISLCNTYKRIELFNSLHKVYVSLYLDHLGALCNNHLSNLKRLDTLFRNTRNKN